MLLALTATKLVQPATLTSFGKSEAPTCDSMIAPASPPPKKTISKLTGLTVWSKVFTLEVAAAPKDRIGLAVHQHAAIVSQVDVCRNLVFLCPFGLLQLTNID